eukprot:65649_1
MILVIIYLLIIVFNLKINTVSSEDEKNIENDFLYSKIRAAVLNGDTVIKQGKKKIINERNCYASMLFTSDEGKIVLNQVVIPGGKKKKLSKAVTENLVKLGLSEGVENGPVVVVVEVGAWWGNKGMIQLGRYKSLINNGLVYICIADHLTKHQGQAFVDTLENQLKTVAYGAATYTCVTQPNDLTANSLLDEGVKCFSEHYILTNGSDIVPSWDIICNLQLTLTNTINETPTYTAAIAKDYSRGGYTLDYEIGHDSEDDKLLHGVEFGGNESFLAGLFPKGVQELIEKYGSPFDAPGAEIAELCKKAGRKDTPDGYAHFHPSVVQQILGKQLIAIKKKGNIYLRNIGECAVFISSLATEPKPLDQNIETKLENGCIIDMIDSSFCRTYLFDIHDIDEDPLLSTGAGEGETFIEQNGNMYHLKLKNQEYFIDTRTYNEKSLATFIHNAMDQILPNGICENIVYYWFGDINHYLAYLIGSNTLKTKKKKSTKRRIGPRTTTHNSQAPDGGVQAFMNAQIHEQLRAWYDDNQ